MKDWLLLFFCVIFPIALFCGGCYQLHQHIYHKMDCKQFNIDHLEVRTGIDIPAKQTVTCDLNAAGNRRVNTILIKPYVDMEAYVKKNDFIFQIPIMIANMVSLFSVLALIEKRSSQLLLSLIHCTASAINIK